MRRRALIALALLAAVAAPAIARGKKKSTRKKGKVVRIERHRRGGRDLLRACPGATSAGGALCWGQPPRVGETGVVIDEAGVLGHVHIDTVTPVPDTCKNEASWNVTGPIEDGDLSAVTVQATLLLGYAEQPNARIIQQNGQIVMPGPRKDETLMTAVDHNGDDQPELLITWYYCDLTGAQQPYGTASTAYCMVYYERSEAGGSFEELRTDVVKYCY